MAMYTPNQFQTQLFDEIFSSTKGKRKITAELMEVLGCSRASLYRKRTGTTPLTTDELIRLADHFSLSIDALRKNAEENSLVVVCTTLPPIKGYDDIDFYLDNTRRNLNQAVNVSWGPIIFYRQRKFPFIVTWTAPHSVLSDFIYGITSTCAATIGLTLVKHHKYSSKRARS